MEFHPGTDLTAYKETPYLKQLVVSECCQGDSGDG